MVIPHRSLLRMSFSSVSPMLLTFVLAKLIPPLNGKITNATDASSATLPVLRPAQLASASVLPSKPGSLLVEVSAFGEVGEAINHSSLVRSQEPISSGYIRRNYDDGKFSEIREAYGDPALEIVLKDIEFTSTGEGGAGKSGAAFRKTPDDKYFLKTMSKRDVKAWDVLKDAYFEYMLKNVEKTTLCRVIGMLKVKKTENERGANRWLIMSNKFPAKFPVMYDLKGSTTDRLAEGNYEIGKDMNWRNQGLGMHLDDTTQTSILRTLKEESLLLRGAELLDYSLIVGQASFAMTPCDGCTPFCVKGSCFDVADKATDPIYLAIKQAYCSNTTEGWVAKKHKDCLATLAWKGTFFEVPTDAEVTLHFECFGIIDFLKPWDVKAKAENNTVFKMLHRGVGDGFLLDDLSNQEPAAYQERFYNAMEESTFTQKTGDFRKTFHMTDKDCNSTTAWGTVQYSME